MLRRLLFLFTRHRFNADLDEEMRLHRDLRAKKLGDPEAAQRQFGNNLRLQEESRDAWGWTWLESVAQDLRYAVRVLKRSPVFTLSAIVTLALGIGANAALFTLLNALLLKPLPVKEPSRLVQLSTNRGEESTAFCYPAFQAIAQHTKTLNGLFTWVGGSPTLGRGADAHKINGAAIGGHAFQTLGLQPEAGRLFTPKDDADAVPLVAILSDRFWQHEFNRDPRVIGRTLLLNRHPFLVIGIAPKSFYGMFIGEDPDVFITFHADALLHPRYDMLHQKNIWWLPIFARLKPGVSLQQANAELRVLSRPVFQSAIPSHISPTELRQFLSQTLLATPGGMGAQFIADRYRQPLLVLIAISGLVLLVACINIANLLLARAAARSREISVRLAVGAARWRVVRQLLTESVLLSLLGTLLGAFLAWASIRLAIGFLPFKVDLAPDWRIAGFLAALVLLTALLFGAAPALAGTDFQANEVLKQGRAGSRRGNRLNRLLVCGQIALSLVLLMGAFLFIQTFENLKWQNFGFDRHNLAFVGLDTERSGLQAPQLAQFYQDLLARVSALHGVRSVSLTSLTPMTGGYSADELPPELWPNLSHAERILYTHQVSPAYFQTMRTPILEGRDFDASDEAPSQPPPAIVTATAAHTYFPRSSAVGQILKVDTNESYRIVGVVRDSLFANLRNPQLRAIYIDAMHAAATKQSAFTHRGSWTLALRTQGDSAPVLSAIRTFIKHSGKDIVITDDLPINTLINQGLRTERTMAILAAFFASITAILVSLGLYGLLAYTVTRRTTEIGVRLALGAPRKSVLWLILKDALLLAVTGVCLGIPAVLLSGKLITSMLYQTSPNDPITLAVTATLILCIAALAGFLPAWRAAKVNLTIALRWE